MQRNRLNQKAVARNLVFRQYKAITQRQTTNFTSERKKEFNMTAEFIFQFKKMLNNLDECLKKASAFADHRKFDSNLFTQSRLAPDMFPLVKQVQSACDVAKFCAAYLSEKTPPKHEDNEITMKELHERIAKVTAYLETFHTGDFENFKNVKVKPGWAKGKWISGDAYLFQIAIPNFYFHVTTAYAILRHAGVDVGKMDFLGQINLQD